MTCLSTKKGFSGKAEALEQISGMITKIWKHKTRSESDYYQLSIQQVQRRIEYSKLTYLKKAL